MNQIPRSDWLSRNNISPQSKWVHESFLPQNIVHDSKKVFCDSSVGMELEKEKLKPKRVITFAYNWLPFQCSKINKYEDHFFSALFAI